MAFGGLVAVNAVSLHVRTGEVFGLIGPNGAGKTAMFNAMTGFTIPTSGRILFADQDITALPSWKRVRMGLARTFQNLRLFPEMTVFQTVLIGRQAGREAGPVAQLLGTRRAQQEDRACRERAFEEIAFVGLEKKINTEVKHLPYGDRRRVEIARALATDPSLLLLDEPAAGMKSAGVQRSARCGPAYTRPELNRRAGRASHARGDGGLRPNRGSRPWDQDCRGRPGGDSGQP